jgi:hypothetical protein
MRGHCCRVPACRDNQLAPAQGVQRGLNRTLGEARLIRDHAQARRHWPPALSRRSPKEKEVDQKRRGLLIVGEGNQFVLGTPK